MAELNMRIDLSFGKGSLRFLMIAGALLAAASDLASESVTLSTYYPAPSGIYSQMITTGQTTLARDGGGVDVGDLPSATPPPGGLYVKGRVGIGAGNNSPADQLSVAGSVDLSGNLIVGSGLIQMKDGNQALGKVMTSDANGWATWQAAGWQSGMWCGNSFANANGLAGCSGTINARNARQVSCQGKDPASSCPAGFTQTQYALDDQGSGRGCEAYYTCIKN